MSSFPLSKSFLGSFLVLLGFYIQSAEAYYGRKSIQAVLRFETSVEVSWQEKIPALSSLNKIGVNRNRAVEAVRKQVLHLDGVFHSEEFAKRWGGPASCGPWYNGDMFDVTFTGVDSTVSGRLILNYQFAGTIVVQKDPLRRNNEKDFSIWLPRAPDLIFQNDIKWGKNQCTDKADNGPESFYYYWDPWLPHCSLQYDQGEQVHWITASVERIDNTRYSYPDYDRLYKTGQKEKTLDIAIFLGYVTHGIRSTRQPYMRDSAGKTFRQIEDLFSSDEVVENVPKFVVNGDGSRDTSQGINRLARFERVIKTAEGPVVVRVMMLLSDTELHAKDPTFRTFLVPAMKNSDILIYSGHSGDGDNLSPEKLGFKSLGNKYQILFIDGCDSYMNYLTQFLNLRGDRTDTDLVLTSFPAAAGDGVTNEVAFLTPFLDGKSLSWQTILDRLEDSNGDSGTFLTGVFERGEFYRAHPDNVLGKRAASSGN